MHHRPCVCLQEEALSLRDAAPVREVTGNLTLFIIFRMHLCLNE